MSKSDHPVSRTPAFSPRTIKTSPIHDYIATISSLVNLPSTPKTLGLWRLVLGDAIHLPKYCVDLCFIPRELEELIGIEMEWIGVHPISFLVSVDAKVCTNGDDDVNGGRRGFHVFDANEVDVVDGLLQSGRPLGTVTFEGPAFAFEDDDFLG